jgi:MoaA/NifB/PqqE/SkfB family radical SAM enzyme
MMSIQSLRRLRLELALDCPLRCAHCSANAAPGHPLAMPPGLAQRLIDEFAAMGGTEVTFTGGEPLLIPELPALLTKATARGLSTVAFTSGIVASAAGPVAAAVDQFTALSPVLGRAVFSVYSAKPATHDAITRLRGSLRQTQAAVRHAVAAGIATELHFVPTRLNYRDLPALAEAANGLGVSAIRIIRYVPHGRGRIAADVLSLRQEEQREFKELLRLVMADGSIPLRVGSAFGYLIHGVPPCTAALEELVVTSDGRVAPCSGFTGYRGDDAIGNVINVPLARVWSESPYLWAVRAMLSARAGCSPGGLEPV